MVKRMNRVANVFVNIPVKSIAKAYTYLIPETFAFVTAGWRVLVPFGARSVEGFIIEIAEREDCGDLKPILDLVDQEAWFDEKMMRAARWISMFYLCSAAEAMRLFMPGKTGLKIKTVYRALPALQGSEIPADRHTEREIYAYILKKETAGVYDLRKQFAGRDTDRMIQYLLRQKVISREYAVKKRAANKYEYRYALKGVPAENILDQFTKKPAQKKLLALLLEKKEVTAADLKAEKISTQTVRALLDAEYIVKRERQILRNSYQSVMAEQRGAVVLNEEQRRALGAITDGLTRPGPSYFLLHGITGSGKTQVYMEAVMKARSMGRQAIVLVPEIALTSQIVKRFKQYFADDLIVMHSRLSISERNDAILRMRQKEVGIVIGARSAIFTPMDQIGLIIMDEEHEASYKQDESPRYHTRDVAMKLAELHQAALVLGSATPSVESYAAARSGKAVLLPMTKRIGDIPLPAVQAVDMREELRLGRRNIISNALRQLIEETLAKGEQVIILLNRRGFSTFVLCRTCGHVISCKQCTLPLVYHRSGKLQCHYCDISEDAPSVCPACEGRYIKYFGTGTERLEHELKLMFPTARSVRMDRDTTGGKFAHAEILEDFSQKRYDILLGTQMVAKGHDIQNVTAVGILSADASLNIPDFRSAERCFSLITQAAGRAGRGKIPGRVVIQTYNPEHYAVVAAAHHDYAAFYQVEIALRKQLFYPPYSELIKLVVQNQDEAAAMAEGKRIVDLLKRRFKSAAHQFFGPSPALIAKLRDLYRVNILIKSSGMKEVRAFLRENQLHSRTDVAIDVRPLRVM